jgi:hypothetical protein
MLRIPHCLDNRLTNGGMVVSPTHRPRSTPQKHNFFFWWPVIHPGIGLLNKSQSQSYITTDSLSANPSWCQTPISDPRPIFSLLSSITSGQFLVCCCGAPSLTISRVCSFQFLPGIASEAFLRSESHWTHEHSLFSLFLRLFQPGRSGSCIYFPHNRVAQLYSWALGY